MITLSTIVHHTQGKAGINLTELGLLLPGYDWYHVFY
jgi:hypothetical protein